MAVRTAHLVCVLLGTAILAFAGCGSDEDAAAPPIEDVPMVSEQAPETTAAPELSPAELQANLEQAGYEVAKDNPVEYEAVRESGVEAEAALSVSGGDLPQTAAATVLVLASEADAQAVVTELELAGDPTLAFELRGVRVYTLYELSAELTPADELVPLVEAGEGS